MAFKEVHKILTKTYPELTDERLQQHSQFFSRLKGKPFWIWGDVEQHKAEDIKTKGDCCFNHIVGLPVKSNTERPLYPYQKTVYDALDKHKHVWIKKSTGLGITEFMLRYMAWLCLKDKTLAGSQMCVVTGPRIDLAITLIDRMKRLFEPKGRIYFDTKETVIELNGCTIEAYPSHHLDAMRGLANVSFILNDESDFYPIGQQQDARDVSERYIAKSNPWIVMVSTPNKPGGLFEQIELEPAERCLYSRIFLDYTYGLGKIYSEEEIAEAMASPSFQREYCNKYGGYSGNVFSEPSIQAAIDKGAQLCDPTTNPKVAINPFAKKAMAIDPGWGSSACGFFICQLINVNTATDPVTKKDTITKTYTDSYFGSLIQVLYAEEFYKPNFNAMVDIARNLMYTYGIIADTDARVYMDGSASAFIRALKIAIGEDSRYEEVIERAKHSGFRNINHWLGKVIPVSFSTTHKKMLEYTKLLMDKQYVAIHPSFNKLITALRTAHENDGTLDKDRTAHNDILDCVRMCLLHFEMRN